MRISNRSLALYERGAALIIVLAFVVLLTGLVLAYFTRSTTDRQVAHGSFNQTKVDQLALSAANMIVTDLEQEIANGSVSPAPTFGSGKNIFTLYSPTSNANMLPMRSGTPSPTPIPGSSDPSFSVNLIRRSVRDNGSSGTNPMPAPGVPSRASTVNSTTDISANGRSISLARWNKHYLLPRYDQSSIAVDTTPPSPLPSAFNPNPPVANGFTPPDWVMITRENGPQVLSTPKTGSDGSSITPIGRYAYAIYDEGGLLDANAVGYPSNTTAIQSGRKGSIAFADLTIDPGINLPQFRVDDLVGWRNYATTQPAGDFSNNFTFDATSASKYFNFIVSNTTAFTKTSGNVWNGRTDQALLNRQQLINLRTSLGTQPGFSQNVLQYLGTFSRELNSPSFAPATPSAINPDFSMIRVTSPFTRFDGSDALKGEPLVKTRFPLNRLAWITYKGSSASLASTDPVITQLLASGVTLATIQAGTADNIKVCFGLTFPNGGTAGDPWKYTNPNGNGAASTIMRLDEVAAANPPREPDFFELLQAGILAGSLGQSSGGVSPAGSTVFGTLNTSDPTTNYMNDVTQHILSIGAAIIDQADPDSIPTRIQFNGTNGNLWTAYGVESLPYITQLYPVGGRSSNDALNNTWAAYLLFQLWNPHQTMIATPTVRLRLNGFVGAFRGGNGETWDPATGATTNATDKTVTLSSSASFSVPMPLSVNNTTVLSTSTTQRDFSALVAPTPNPTPSPATASLVGFRLNDFPSSTPTPVPTNNSHLFLQIGASTKQGNKTTAHPFEATLEVDAGGGVWVPYNRFIGIDDSNSWIIDAPVDVRDSQTKTTKTVPVFTAAQWAQAPPAVFMKADPRSTRFGIFQLDTNDTPGSRLTLPLWPSGVPGANIPNGYGGAVTTGPPGPVEHAPLRFASAPYYPATFCINNDQSTTARNTATTNYADNDTIIRFGDSVYDDTSNNTKGSSTPYYNTDLSYHPIVLNRPLRSVAELGYAFRDLPWKSLDLFTQNSADAGLLDIFSVNDEPAMIAGRINLNTRQAPVLQSILPGAIWDELTSSSVSNNTSSGAQSAPTMVGNIVSATSTAPLQNKAALITSAGLPLTILPTPPPTITTPQNNQTVKARREVVARALSSVSQTRTWNLMIDVIAQSGRYAPGATDLAKFVVEGEQRYWVHVAIDRFTGEVIDRQVEVVKE